MHNGNGLVALVTGGNGALGEAISYQLADKGYEVILAGRNEVELEKKTTDMQKKFSHVYSVILEVTSQESIENCYKVIIKKYGKLDVLVNNAAIYPDNRVDEIYPNFFDLNFEDLKKTIETNFYGAFNLSRKFLPDMIKNNFGRIVNVSSGMARFEDLDTRGPFYRMSKVALNSLTCILAELCRGKDICINSVCPGWVRSKMGGTQAVRSPAEGARGIVWAAMLPTGGATGQFFRDGEPLDWCLKLGDPY